MRGVVFLLISSLVLANGAQKRGDRDGADPPPTVPVFIPKPGRTKPLKKAQPARPPVINETYLQRELKGFGVGQPLHRSSLQFCHDVASEIKNLLASGRDIQRIVVTGYADGIPNRGLDLHIRDFPVSCQKGFSLPVDDPELARLRACIILERLTEMLSKPVAAGIAWEKSEYDEPDGGDRGNVFRKVKIEVFLRSKL